MKRRAQEIEKMHEVFDAQNLLLFPWNAALKYRFVRIVPAETTGRRFTVTNMAAAWHESTVVS